MDRERFPLDKIKVAAPCTADWRHMYGDERVRFCGQCSQNVYNLSALTREQAEDLILRHEGRLCVRFYQRKDGTVLINNCPVGLAALKAKYHTTKATIVKAAMTFLAYLGVLWWVEAPPIVTSMQGAVTLPHDGPVVMGDIGALPPYLTTRLVRRSEPYIRERAIYKVTPVGEGNQPVKGDVVVAIIILPSGEVERATLIKGPESIKEIAEGAALRWKFAAMTDGGELVRVESTLTFHFSRILPEGVSRAPVRDERRCEACL
jgi:hypothetical protein